MKARKMMGQIRDWIDSFSLVEQSAWEWLIEEFATIEEKLAEYENDETARRRADAFKIRQLKADILVLERKYRDAAQGRKRRDG